MIEATEQGIVITRAALKALLAFTPTEDPSGRLDVVAIRVDGEGVTARASDNDSAVELSGEDQGFATPGFWDIDVHFMTTCCRALSGNDQLRIEPSGATVRSATVLRQVEDGEDWEEAESLTFAADAARLQREFPWGQVSSALDTAGESGSAVALDARILARLALVQKAAGSSFVTVHIGSDPTAPVVVQCGPGACVVVMPVVEKRKVRGEKAGNDVPAQSTLELALNQEFAQKAADATGLPVAIEDESGGRVASAEPSPKPRRKAKK